MPWPTVDAIRTWTARRKGVLRGVVSAAVETGMSFVPGLSVAGKLLGEVAAYGFEHLVDPAAEVPDVKERGQAFPPEQLDQINGWLESLTRSHGELLDALEKRLSQVTGQESLAQLTALVQQAVQSDAALLGRFDGCLAEVRRQTLSLALIERKLDEHFHVQRQMWASLEEIKGLLVNLPGPAQLQKVHPESLDAVGRADEHFLAGRREQGVAVLVELMRGRGVGEATLIRHLAPRVAAHGADLPVLTALRRSAAITAPASRPLTTVGSWQTRGVGLKVWRSLPRGLVIGKQYRIEEEIGRGGMASVYRVVGVGMMTRNKVRAIKVPASELLTDEETCARFLQEAEIAEQFSSEAYHSGIVRTYGALEFNDPHDGGHRVGLVLEYIEGETLARHLERRQQDGQRLNPDEIQHVLDAVCAALAHAHGQAHPVLHRDVKPHNVLLGGDLAKPLTGRVVKLMDFGIARILDDQLNDLTRTGQVIGTPGFVPPEFLAVPPRASVQSDVYLLGCLLRMLLTFDPNGAVDRATCPEAWQRLLGSALHPWEEQRPASVAAFREHLREGVGEYQAKVTGREMEYRHGKARELAARFDFAEAVRELERVPEARRQERLHQELLKELTGKRDRVNGLVKTINERTRGGKADLFLRPLVIELQSLQPPRDDLQKLLQSLPREGTNSIGMRFALIPAGRFLMGSPETEEGRNATNEPQHEVEITRAFCMGVFPVTQEQYQRIMGSNPSHFSGNPTHPVEKVIWDEAVEFCRRLSSLASEKEHGRVYRLPTEAEWEYSCRGGAVSNTPFHYGNTLSSTQANFGNTLQRTSPVGTYKPNAWGLHDLHGNVWEWCSDFYDENYYNQSPRQNPQGPNSGSSRVLRGGSWTVTPRIAARPAATTSVRARATTATVSGSCCRLPEGFVSFCLFLLFYSFSSAAKRRRQGQLYRLYRLRRL